MGAEWVGRAPGAWTRGRIKDLLCIARNGVWGDEPRDDGTDVACVRATDFDRPHLRVLRDRLPARNVDGKNLRQHRLEAGNLILEKSGGGEKQPVGMSVLFDLEIDAVCSNFCARLVAASHIEPRFLTYALASAYSTGLTERAIKQTTGIQNLDTDVFFNVPWAWPALGEQRRIADFLDAETARIDRLISLRSKQQRFLADRYAITIADLATPGWANSGPRSQIWPWLPAGLATSRLGRYIEVQTGVTVDASRKPGPDDVEVPYMRVANVQDESIDLQEVKMIRIPAATARRTTLHPGDVLVTEANGNPDNLGRGAEWDGSIPRMVHQNHIFAIRCNQEHLLPGYLTIVLTSVHGRRYFRFTSNQVGIATTSSSKIRDMPLHVPSVKAQREVITQYAAVRGQFDEVSTKIELQLRLLAERRQALITAAVTGQMDVGTVRGADPS